MDENEGSDVHQFRDAEEFRMRTAQLATMLSLAGTARDVHAPDLISATSRPIYAVGGDGIIQHCNQAFVDLVGRPAVDLVGCPVSELVHELDHQVDDPLIGRHDNAEASTTQSLVRYVRPDGEVVWTWSDIVDLESGCRWVRLVDVTVHIDVIGRSIAAREVLADRQQRYRSLALPGADPVVRVALDGTVLDMNAAARELTGFEIDGSQNVDVILADEARPLLRGLISAAVSDGESHQLQRQRLQLTHGDGHDERWFVIRVVPELAAGHSRSVHLVLGDVTGRVEDERRLTELALTDPLTGVANRAAVQDRLEHAMQRLRRSPGSGLAVVALDIDRFKSLNDIYGHAFGDAALVQFALHAQQEIRGNDTIGRIGGDEFLVILEDAATPDDARLAAQRLESALNPLVVHVPVDGGDNVTVELATSMGMAWTAEPIDVSTIVAEADDRLMLAKRSGRGHLWLPNDGRVDLEASAGSARRATLRDLRGALERDQLVVAYQPILDRQGVVHSVEALIRWAHPARGTLMPDEFVGLMAETGQMLRAGIWVADTALRQAAAWRAESGVRVNLNINASAAEVARSEYRQAVLDVLTETGLDGSSLSIELREDALDGSRVPESAVAELADVGVRFVLDGFGTGLSSLTNLQSSRVMGVKIDRSLVSRAAASKVERGIVRGVTELAHRVGVEVTAVGIETAEQAEWIASIGCDFVQGFHLGVPTSPGELESTYFVK